MNEKRELLKPKYDVVFQALFENNKDNITESFISDILGEKVKILEILADNTLMKEYPTDKVGRLDLKTKFEDGTMCQIEMQLTNQREIIDRMLYYWAKTFSSQLKIGDEYKELNRTIGILITDFEIKEIKEIEKVSTKWKIIETENKQKILTNKLELHIIEIPKANKILEKEKDNKVAQWITFIDNPNTERVKEIMENNKEVKKARDVLYVMSEDEKLQRLAFLKERAERDEKSIRSSGYRDGYDEGKEDGRRDGLEEGRKEGRKEGMQEGIQEGRLEGKREGIQEGKKEGIQEEKIKIAKNLIKLGLNKEKIAEATGLTEKELNNI